MLSCLFSLPASSTIISSYIWICSNHVALQSKIVWHVGLWTTSVLASHVFWADAFPQRSWYFHQCFLFTSKSLGQCESHIILSFWNVSTSFRNWSQLGNKNLALWAFLSLFLMWAGLPAVQRRPVNCTLRMKTGEKKRNLVFSLEWESS